MAETAAYVLLPKAAEIIGTTVKAIERKIERGQWLEGEVWRLGPDGRRYVSMEGHKRWVESGKG